MNWIEQYSTRGAGALTSVWLLIPFCPITIYSAFKQSVERQRGLLVIYRVVYPALFFKELKPIGVFVIRIKNLKILVVKLQKIVL